ncbi:SpdD-like protein [Streptomyces lasiicapitis]|uniref:SpdD-like protein n=1 Tax=Streptomyces lasiicapitis TaxID=1923961 RepID=UPI00368885B0
MFKPHVPTNQMPTGDVIPYLTPTAITPPGQASAPATCSCRHTTPPPPPAPVTAPVSARPTVQLTPGALIAVVVGGTTVVLVVGAVLVSLLLAVALCGVSLTICALVIRSLVNTQAKQR